jgi:predicted phage tail protein
MRNSLFFLALILAACDSSPLADDGLGRPQLSVPLDGARVADAIQFEWEEVDTAVNYRLQLGNDPSFAEPMVDAGKIFQGRHVVQNLEIGESYVWRVAAIDDAGQAEWSAPRTFTVDSHAVPPPRPVLRLPANKAQDQPLATAVEWEAIEGVTGYQLQVSLESRLQLLVVDLENISETRFDIQALVNSYPYWWRVRAANPAGYGPWSSTWTFVVTN